MKPLNVLFEVVLICLFLGGCDVIEGSSDLLLLLGDSD